MGKRVTRVAMTVAAACALGTLAVIGAGAAGSTAKAAALPARAPSAGTFQAPSVPGAQLWVGRFKGRAAEVVASPDGSTVFVMGAATGATRDDYATMAYNAATGAQLWFKRYNGPGNGYDDATSVAVSPDGGTVFVTGASQGISTGYDYATVAYNAATGARLWARRYNSPGNGDDFAYSVAASPDGSTVFVTGLGQGISTGQDYATVAYNAATGAQLWAHRYNGPGNGDDVAGSVAASPDGSTVFVTGFSPGTSSGEDYATVAYNAATGAQLWARRYNSPGNGDDSAFSVIASPDGSRVFVTGYGGVMVAYDAATGTTLWVQRYPANARSVAVSPSGGTVFVTGFSAYIPEDYATVAYDAATGAEQWAQTYNEPPGGGSDDASSVAVSPDGSKVFVTGTSQGLTSGGMHTSDDYATVAYDAATGTQQWVQRYNGPGNGGDYAFSVAAGPDGQVFVTGYSQFGISATIAYTG